MSLHCRHKGYIVSVLAALGGQRQWRGNDNDNNREVVTEPAVAVYSALCEFSMRHSIEQELHTWAKSSCLNWIRDALAWS